jgi:response regulator RpfG family c-di-GMP phosphodiesterase
MHSTPAATAVPSPDAASARGAVLCVDDEANILNALTRVLRRAGHHVLTAQGGAEALALLKKQSVDVIISDMRMPQMDGAELLATVAARWPDTVRLLLTGYADIESTVAAINKGGIYRYLAKPWEDNDLSLTVGRAIEMRRLEQERHRLETLTQAQNEELKALNAGLEARVQARTAELEQLLGFVNASHDSLKKHYSGTVKLFANLLELRSGTLAGHSRRAAPHARRLAQWFGLSETEISAVHHAALLHDLGMIGLPDALVRKPFNTLTAEERAAVMRHPLIGEALLLELEPLADAAHLIRHHHERYDGQGYPDRLASEKIPLGARIIALASDYDALQLGLLAPQRMSPGEAREFLVSGKGKRYDPALTDAFVALLGEEQSHMQQGSERVLRPHELAPGMVLSRDLITRDGMLLLNEGYKLDAAIVKRIHDFERTLAAELTVYVRTGVDSSPPR